MTATKSAFIWRDLITDNAAQARAFYGEVFNWSTEERVVDGAAYTVLKVGDTPVAGIWERPAAETDPDATHWVNYLEVADVEMTLSRAREMGAPVLREHFVEGLGQLAVVEDPEGARVGLLQRAPKASLYMPHRERPCHVSWTERAGGDPVMHRDFYVNLFAWGLDLRRLEEWGDYFVADNGHEEVAGLTPSSFAAPDAVAWTPYIWTEDVTETAAKAQRHGAQLLQEPRALHAWGRISDVAVLQDPGGATFCLYNRLHDALDDRDTNNSTRRGDLDRDDDES